jgi:homoserine dehydrogenase
MINIAILGFGTVGSGVFEIIKNDSQLLYKKSGKALNVKYILDKKDFSEHSDSNIFTTNLDDILGDKEVDIIVETIGGTEIAYNLTKKAFGLKKHVVTSNKDLIAAHGPELLGLAQENHVQYLFEASVGGGIPIIKSIKECLHANKIESIEGILNGTTNYILSRMLSEKLSFTEALKDAQEKGYAEADPSSDIEGADSARKLAILSSIAFESFVEYKKIPTEGIQNVTYQVLRTALSNNTKIKLIALSRIVDGKVATSVKPTVILEGHPLYYVDGVNNAILVTGNNVGQVMFYGQGAGKLATASAVVGDIIDIVKKEKASD